MAFDSLSTAKQVSFGSTLKSDVGAVSSFDRSDFYRFEVKSNSGAFLSLSGLNADASLTLMDATGKSVSVSNRAGTSAEAININLGIGTYYIGVGQVNGNTTYKLNLSSNAAFANIDETINWLSGDFNGDGFEDVLRQKKGAVVDAVNGVQFFLGTTGGGFQAPVNVANMPSMQGNVVNLIAGDFNGDGRTDLIRQEKGAWVDGVGDAQILTFQNGNFQIVADMPNPGALNGNFVNLIAGDFNGDGRTDLIRQEKGAWVNGDADVQVMLSKGGWEFTSPAVINNAGAMTGNNVTLVASGSDLMRLETGAWVNGSNDVQFTSFANGNFSAPVNNPTDAFSKAVVSSPWESAMARTYAANQGVLGQLVSNQATNVSPYGTTGRYSKYSTGGSIHWSAKTGAVVLTLEMEKIYGRVGGSGTWLGMPTGNQYAWKDGTRQDFEGGYLFRNASLATALRANELPVVANDFTGDGKADILWRNSATGGNLFWQMNGTTQTGSAWTDAVTDKNFKLVGIGDFDRDGQNDILWNHAVTGDNVIWRMNGTKHIGDLKVDKATNLNWQIAGVADFDKDGRVDILWRNQSTGENLVWKMDNNIHVGDLKIQFPLDTSWQIAGVADFTGDRQADILWRNNVTGETLFWEMNGTSRTAYIGTDRVADMNWEVASTSDFTGDGKTDILWQHKGTGQNLVWQMDGTTHRSSGDVWMSQVSDVSWTIAGTKGKGRSLVTPELNVVYTATGGSGGWLGQAKGEQYNWNGGIRQDFDGGYLFRNAAMTKALRPNEMPFVVTGYAFTDAINRVGGLGVVGDQRNAQHAYGQGIVQDFAKGTDLSLVMQLKGSNTAYVVNGEILKQYWIAKGPTSFLGYAASDRFEFNGGYRQNFEGGCIVVNAQGTTEVFDNTGKNRSDVLTNVFIQAFNRVGGQSVLGWQANDSHAWGDGEVQNFEVDRTNRSVIMQMKGADKAYVVRGEMLEKYYRAAGPASFLGYPTSDRFDSTGGYRQNFQGGFMTQNAKGLIEIFNYFGQNRSSVLQSDFSWAQPVYGKPWDLNIMTLPGSGGSQHQQITANPQIGGLGNPTSNIMTDKNGNKYQYFEGGAVQWDSAGRIVGAVRGFTVADVVCDVSTGNWGGGPTLCGDSPDRDFNTNPAPYRAGDKAWNAGQNAYGQHDKDVKATGNSPLNLMNPGITAAHRKLANNPNTALPVSWGMGGLANVGDTFQWVKQRVEDAIDPWMP